jgi:maleylacetate reductase
MVQKFRLETLPGQVLFGEGVLNEVTSEVNKLGSRALVISTPQQTELAKTVELILGKTCVALYDKAVMHVPYETVVDALELVHSLKIDVLVAPGGGSTIGLAKAIALETHLPILAIPTTYAGSEMTPIWGITRDGLKTTGRNIVVKPKTVLYDPTLTLGLPVGMSVTSGMNAIAHAVEALYAQDANPIASLMAEECIRALSQSLPKVAQNPGGLEARAQAQYGAWLGGSVLGMVGMSLHHKLCHTLGGSYNLPHAETHTVILPHATAYNFAHAPEAMQAVARALNVSVNDVPLKLFELAKTLGAPTSLKEIGMKEEKLSEAATLATKNPYYNPRPVVEKDLQGLLDRAFRGEQPMIEKVLERV